MADACAKENKKGNVSLFSRAATKERASGSLLPGHQRERGLRVAQAVLRVSDIIAELYE